MPMYLGKAVSDEYLQSLIEAYRDGQAAAGHEKEMSDEPVIAKLEAAKVEVAGPTAYGLGTMADGSDT